jgi:WD40 repeat protein
MAALEEVRPLLVQVSQHGGSVTGVAYSPDGSILASGGCNGPLYNCERGNVVLWDPGVQASSAEVLAKLTGHWDTVSDIAFSPNGETLASGSWDSTVQLWDVDDRRPLGRPLRAHKNQVTSVAFSPDGKTLASGGDDGFVFLWDFAAGEGTLGSRVRLEAEDAGAVATVAYSPDGTLLATGHRWGDIILWDPESREPIGKPIPGGGEAVPAVAFSADGAVLAVGDWAGKVRLYDLQAARESEYAKLPLLVPPLTGLYSRATSVAISPDGQIVAGGGCLLFEEPHYCMHGGAVLWDLATGHLLGEMLGGLSESFRGYANWTESLAFSPDGQRLAAGSLDGVVQIWRVGVEAWSEAACASLKRNLSREEWEYYLRDDLPYRETCPGL